jgi:hypothetical protein
MKSVILATLGILSVGCTYHSGRQLPAEAIARLKVGETTQQAALDSFGPPIAHFVDGRGLAFTWHYNAITSAPFVTKVRQEILTCVFTNGILEKFILTGPQAGESKP